jgi:hypothetical protein
VLYGRRKPLLCAGFAQRQSRRADFAHLIFFVGIQIFFAKTKDR